MEVTNKLNSLVARIEAGLDQHVPAADTRPARLHAAYNDKAGVTAEFTLNLLQVLNREVGADFDLDGWEHRAPFNEEASRIEMHLVSRRGQTVHVGDRAFEFAAGEVIVTEYQKKDRLRTINIDLLKAKSIPAAMPRAAGEAPEGPDLSLMDQNGTALAGGETPEGAAPQTAAAALPGFSFNNGE